MEEPLVMDQDAAKIDPLLEQMEIRLSITGFPQKPKTAASSNRVRKVFMRGKLNSWRSYQGPESSDNPEEMKTTIDFAYCCSAYKKIRFSFRLSKQSNVEGLLNQIREKLKLSYVGAELRLLRIVNHVISEIIDPSVKIQNLHDVDGCTFDEELRAELIPEEDKNLGCGDYLIRVHNFKKKKDVQSGELVITCFGNPFLLVIHEGETINQVKIRLGMKLKVDDTELSKWKLLLWELGLDARYLEDGDVASDHFKEKVAFLGPGFEHLERAFVLATFHLGLQHHS